MRFKRIAAVLVAISMLLLSGGCALNSETLKQKAENIINSGFLSSDKGFSFDKTNYPKLGGTLAFHRLGEAVTATVLGTSRKNADEIIFFDGGVFDSYKALCDGETDILITNKPDKKTEKYIKKSGSKLEMKPIGLSALVFLCSPENKTDGLTVEQLKGIFSGKITSWYEVGGEKSEIAVFHRIDGSYSRMLLERMIPVGDRNAEPVKTYMETATGTMEALADYDNSRNALGYKAAYDIDEEQNNSDYKLLEVDGIAASRETVSDGTYPLTEEFYVVIRADAAASSPERILYNWVCSSQCKTLIENEGFVPFEQ